MPRIHAGRLSRTSPTKSHAGDKKIMRLQAAAVGAVPKGGPLRTVGEISGQSTWHAVCCYTSPFRTGAPCGCFYNCWDCRFTNCWDCRFTGVAAGLRNRMQAIKNYAAASRSCRGRPKGRPAVNSWRDIRTVNMARSMLLCPAIPNGCPAWSPLQLLGLSIHRNCVETM